MEISEKLDSFYGGKAMQFTTTTEGFSKNLIFGKNVKYRYKRKSSSILTPTVDIMCLIYRVVYSHDSLCSNLGQMSKNQHHCLFVCAYKKA